MRSRRIYLMAVCGLVLAVLVASVDGQAAQASKTYSAKLVPLNASVAGSKARGEARFTISGNTLTIRLNAQGLPPGMMHMVHWHGFLSGKAATCPGVAADTNHDGIIDLKETEPAAGVTLVPLNGDPAALKIASNTYPIASKTGRISYKQSVSLAALNREMAMKFSGTSLDLDKRVVFVHGVPASTTLPASVASLPGVPAQVTLPIACGKIVRTK
ncbi:MAG: hypothetical protein ACRD3O_02100 [Terriglobia bacterium]